MATDKPMQLGMIGLGRMGANLVRRVMGDGHRCVVYDVSADTVKALETEGATGSSSLADFVGKLEKPALHVDHGAGGDRPRHLGPARRPARPG